MRECMKYAGLMGHGWIVVAPDESPDERTPADGFRLVSECGMKFVALREARKYEGAEVWRRTGTTDSGKPTWKKLKE